MVKNCRSYREEMKQIKKKKKGKKKGKDKKGVLKSI